MAAEKKEATLANKAMKKEMEKIKKDLEKFDKRFQEQLDKVWLAVAFMFKFWHATSSMGKK